MTDLRPECIYNPFNPAPVASRADVLRQLYKSVARRRSLIRGKFDDGDKHCALGCLNKDLAEPIAIDHELVDEIAAINDKLGPRSSPKRRWAYVMRWLRAEVDKLDSQASDGVPQ